MKQDNMPRVSKMTAKKNAAKTKKTVTQVKGFFKKATGGRMK